MGCLNDRSRIATFFEKLAHFFRFVRKIRVITAQTSESKKLRIGNGIFDMGWVGCPTQLISSYLDKIMAPIVKSLPSYIKDSQHALEIFRDFIQIFVND